MNYGESIGKLINAIRRDPNAAKNAEEKEAIVKHNNDAAERIKRNTKSISEYTAAKMDYVVLDKTISGGLYANKAIENKDRKLALQTLRNTEKATVQALQDMNVMSKEAGRPPFVSEDVIKDRNKREEFLAAYTSEMMSRYNDLDIDLGNMEKAIDRAAGAVRKAPEAIVKGENERLNHASEQQFGYDDSDYRGLSYDPDDNNPSV